MMLGERILRALRAPVLLRMRSAKEYVCTEVELLGANNPNMDLWGVIAKRLDGVVMVIAWDQIESLENIRVEQPQPQEENKNDESDQHQSEDPEYPKSHRRVPVH